MGTFKRSSIEWLPRSQQEALRTPQKPCSFLCYCCWLPCCNAQQDLTTGSSRSADKRGWCSPVAEHHGQCAEHVGDHEQPERGHRLPLVHPTDESSVKNFSAHHLRCKRVALAAERVDWELHPRQSSMPKPVPVPHAPLMKRCHTPVPAPFFEGADLMARV